MASEREFRKRRTLVLNPDEPRAGDYGFGLKNKAHPVFGEKDTVEYLRSQLKGLRGKEVTIRLHGYSLNAKSKRKTFRELERTLTLNKYGDVFGPSGAFESMLWEGFRNASSSEDSIIVTSLTVEED